MSALAADRDQLRQFVDSMFRHAARGTYVSLRCMYDRGEEERDALPFPPEAVEVGDRGLLVARALNYAQRCADHHQRIVFAPPVATFTSRKGASLADLAQTVVLSVECDSRPAASVEMLTSIIGRPTLVVASGGLWMDEGTGEVEDKLHAHWRLAVPTATRDAHDLAHLVRRMMREIVESDGTSIPAVHPMRWPGSWHRKDVEKPRLARIVGASDTEVDLRSAGDALRGRMPEPDERRESGDEPEASVDDLAVAINVITNPVRDWEHWNKFGMALFRASGGSKDGLELFHEWSKKCPDYDARTTGLRWAHYRRHPPSRIGAGTIFYMMAEGWDAFEARISDVGDVGNAVNIANRDATEIATAPRLRVVPPVVRPTWHGMWERGAKGNLREVAVARMSKHLLIGRIEAALAFRIISDWNALRIEPPLDAEVLERIFETQMNAVIKGRRS